VLEQADRVGVRLEHVAGTQRDGLDQRGAWRNDRQLRYLGVDLAQPAVRLLHLRFGDRDVLRSVDGLQPAHVGLGFADHRRGTPDVLGLRTAPQRVELLARLAGAGDCDGARRIRVLDRGARRRPIREQLLHAPRGALGLRGLRLGRGQTCLGGADLLASGPRAQTAQRLHRLDALCPGVADFLGMRAAPHLGESRLGFGKLALELQAAGR
jgi:hypothetical protein